MKLSGNPIMGLACIIAELKLKALVAQAASFEMLNAPRAGDAYLSA